MSSLYDKDVTVLNKRSVDMIHDIENTYDQVENNEQIENENNQDIINHDEPIGRSRRQINMPMYLSENYVLGYTNIYNMNVDYCYKMCMTNEPIPDSYEEAMTSPQVSEWKSAMQKEINSLCTNEAWDVVTRGGRVVGARWVNTVKLDNHNNVVKYKAIYVAKGFAQRWGIDYDQTFAPTARLSTIRVLLQMCVQYDLIILHQMDVSSAYLNADIDVDLYIEQPKDFEIGKNKVCKLKQSIYGLKQAGKLWNQV